MERWKPGPPPTKHDALAHDLGLWLSCPDQQSTGFLTWENIEFKTDFLHTKFGYTCKKLSRPDVYAITKEMGTRNL